MCTQRRSDVPHVPMSDEPATTRDHRLSERTYDAGESGGAAAVTLTGLGMTGRGRRMCG